MTNFSVRKNFGFTLVELVITISLMAIVATIVSASYGKFNDARIVKASAEELYNNLRMVQSNARLNKKETASCSSQPLIGWQVEFTDSRSYKIYGRCGAANFGTKIYNLPSAVSVSGANVLFLPLSGLTNLSSDLAITVVGGSTTFTISVTTAGNISISP